MKRKSHRAETFAFPVGIDPLRMLLGIRDHWRVLAVLSLLGFAVGIGAGIRWFQRSYTLEVYLLKTDVSDTRSAYKPRPLRDETLEGLAMDSEVLKATGESISPPIRSRSLAGLMQIAYDRATDRFLMSVTSPKSPERAKEVLDRWIDTFISEGRRLQREEAGDVVDLMRSNVEALDPQIASLNAEILAYSKNEGIFDETSQIENQLQRLVDIEQEIANLDIERQALEVRTASLLDINRLGLDHPTRRELRDANERLRQLRMDYQDAYPGVQAQIQVVDRLEEQLVRDLESLDGELAGFAIGSLTDAQEQELIEFLHERISPALADELRKLGDEKRSMMATAERKKAQLATEKTKLDALPEKVAKLGELQQRKQELEAARSEAMKKQQEAELIHANPVGYVKRFQEVTPEVLTIRRGYLKRAVLALTGLGGFLCLGLLYAAFREMRRKEIRTPLQAAIAMRTVPRLCLLQNDAIADESSAREFWLTNLASPDSRGRRVLFPIVGDLQGEYLFWRLILENIRRDNAKALFIDVARDPVSDTFRKVMMNPVEPDSGIEAPDSGRPIESANGPSSSGDGRAVYVDDRGGVHSGLDEEGREITPAPAGESRALTRSDQQHLLPNDNDTMPCAHYLQAADISVEELGEILQEVPQKYYVLCRWTIGPSSALASLGSDFDQYYLLNCPSATNADLAASHSRIYRKVLDQPDGLILIDPPTRSRILQSIQWLERKFFQMRDDPLPRRGKRAERPSNGTDFFD